MLHSQGEFVADLDEQATLQRSLYEMELERVCRTLPARALPAHARCDR